MEAKLSEEQAAVERDREAERWAAADQRAAELDREAAALQNAVESAFKTAPPFLILSAREVQLQLLSVIRQAEREVLLGQNDCALQTLHKGLISVGEYSTTDPIETPTEASAIVLREAQLVKLISDFRKRGLLSDVATAEAYRYCADQLGKFLK